MTATYGHITATEAGSRGLEPDHMSADETGLIRFYNDAAKVSWGLDDQLPENPPLPFYNGVSS